MSAGTKPLLSICIPTLNRAAFLRESLESLLPQARQSNVEVCICDNASTDDTADYLAALLARGETLRVMRQPNKVDIDANMMSAIGMATGEYIFPLGDDDFVPAGQLARIVAMLDEPASMIILNGWHTDAMLVPRHLHLDEQLAGSSYSSPETTFEAVWDKMPFGAFLASRECFSEPLAQRYMGTSHAYSGVVWDALALEYERAGKISVRCGGEPMVLIRGAEKTWRSNSDLIVLQGIPEYFVRVSRHPAYARVALRIKHAYLEKVTSVRELLYLRSLGQLRRSDLRGLTSECDTSQAMRIRSVARIPSVVARAVGFLAKTVARRVRGAIGGGQTRHASN